MSVSWPLAADRAVRLTGGTLTTQEPLVLTGATLDSRQVRPGMLFACLKGEQTDGHAYAQAAAQAGAGLILASQPLPAGITVPVLLVSEVTTALTALARARREDSTESTWIGITGSNGKTTTKQLIAAACAAAGPVHATTGNLNNHLGVPLTILNLPAGRRFVVVEMGANRPGEIRHLANLARPQIGVICSLGPAHLEGFVDLAGVASEKSEILRALPPGAPALVGVAGLAATCASLGADAATIRHILAEAAAGRSLRLIGDPAFPLAGGLDGDAVVLPGPTRLPLRGAHNLANANVAWQTAIAAGLAPDLALAGLAKVEPTGGRLCPRQLGPHLLLDDSYNANPASMVAGLAVLASQPRPLRLAVLGGMGELGLRSHELHRQVGAEAARLGLELLAVGAGANPIAEGYAQAQGQALHRACDQAEALAQVLRLCERGPCAVLVKASHSVGLHRLVEALQTEGAPC